VQVVNGVTVSLQALVQLFAPARLYCAIHAEIPTASAAVPLSATLPPSVLAGLFRVASVGPVLSTRMLVSTADVVLKPAPSVAMARAS
jgi:hypothetical protein